MNTKRNSRWTSRIAVWVAGAALAAAVAGPAAADPGGRGWKDPGPPPWAGKGRRDARADFGADHHRGRLADRHYRRPVVHGGVIYVPRARVRHYGPVRVVRPYGRWYSGYGHYRRDRDSWRWLALTAITVAIIDGLDERQQRIHEDAQIRATESPLGETVHWSDGAASGTVVPVREGTSSLGRYCREFQQTVTIGGRSERAYGTACLQPDGSWEVVSAGQ